MGVLYESHLVQTIALVYKKERRYHWNKMYPSDIHCLNFSSDKKRQTSILYTSKITLEYSRLTFYKKWVKNDGLEVSFSCLL